MSGNPAGAERDFKTAISLAPERTEALENIANLYSKHKRPVLAKYYYSLAKRVGAGGSVSEKEVKKIMNKSEFF